MPITDMEYNKMIKIESIVIIFFTFSSSLLAGDLESPAAPDHADSAMYKIEDIYNRFNDGTTATKRTTAFVEPSSGPGSTSKTLDELMDKAPAKDNTDGAEPGDVAIGKKYWGLTDGQWGLQTGTASTSSCTRNSSANPVFTNNGDGTVTDNRTCLIWLQNVNCADDTRNWATAQTDVDQLNTNGTMNNNNCGDTSNNGSHQTDWRLPTIKELTSLIHHSYYKPAISNATGDAKWTKDGDAFSNLEVDFYWSSTVNLDTRGGGGPYAWAVDFEKGIVSSPNQIIDKYIVLPVRGGQ